MLLYHSRELIRWFLTTDELTIEWFRDQGRTRKQRAEAQARARADEGGQGR